MSIINEIPVSPMGKQEIYDNVRRYFSAPGAKLAFDLDTGECVYRFYDEDDHATRCCAFGCLIPDNIYTDSMEGNPWESVAHDYRLEGLIDKNEGVRQFMTDVQSLHDSCAQENREDTATFLAYLDVLALAHGLRRLTARPKLVTPELGSYVEPVSLDLTLLARQQMPAHVERHISYIAEKAQQEAFSVICEGLADCTGGTVFGDMSPDGQVQLDELFVLLVRTMAVNAEALQEFDN